MAGTTPDIPTRKPDPAATRRPKFPTSLNGGEHQDTDDVRVGETHLNAPEGFERGTALPHDARPPNAGHSQDAGGSQDAGHSQRAGHSQDAGGSQDAAGDTGPDSAFDSDERADDRFEPRGGHSGDRAR